MKKPSRFTDSWKDAFTFSAGEKRGIYVLLIIIVILAGAIWFYRYYPPAFPKQNYSAFEKEVDEFLAAQAQYDSLKTIALAAEKDSGYRNKSFSPPQSSIAYFEFDPNNLSEEDWKKLGLNSGQIRAINNYQSKGGKFRKKEDLKKMYVISENDYARLEPYIKIKEQPSETTKHFEKRSFTPVATHAAVHIDIGTADTVELLTVKGIGPSRARGIFKYRQLLGGYYSVNQLREVYGIDSAAYDQIAEQVFIKDVNNISKININTATTEEMSRHPYIRKKLAEIIVRYRNQNGNYGDIAAIKKMPLVNDSLYFKLAPYLKVE
jgi:competence protein ComEA